MKVLDLESKKNKNSKKDLNKMKQDLLNGSRT